MKRTMIIAGLLAALVSPAAPAQEVLSQYTTFDRDLDCALLARSAGEGDWADWVCPGYRGYPVFVRYTDGRETVTYGYMEAAGMPTITPFNEASGTVEWRIRAEGEAAYPFAAIQRWFISHPEGVDDGAIRELLVVSKVGQPLEGAACAVAFLPATGNPSANQDARDIADRDAPDFVCGSDPVQVDPALDTMISAQR